MRAREAKDLADVLFKFASTDRTLMKGIEVLYEMISKILKESTPLLHLASEIFPDPGEETKIPTKEKLKELMDACIHLLLELRTVALRMDPVHMANDKLNDLRNTTKVDFLNIIKKGVSEEVFVDIEKRMQQRQQAEHRMTSVLEMVARTLGGLGPDTEDEEDIFDENSEKCKVCLRFDTCKAERGEMKVIKVDDPASDGELTFKLGDVFKSPKEGKT